MHHPMPDGVRAGHRRLHNIRLVDGVLRDPAVIAAALTFTQMDLLSSEVNVMA